MRRRLADAAHQYADVVDFGDFMQARRYLLAARCDWIVTNLRLQAYNGLHLVHLAAAARLPARFIVYADQRDVALAREAQRAGAFYETRARVERAIGAYLTGALPEADRRDPEVPDRRIVSRGGRRSTDISAAAV